MSELTDSVRKMLSQAQIFARDTPFEAVSRARQAVQAVNAAIAKAETPAERAELEALREVATARVARLSARLDAWIAEARAREAAYNEREREVLKRAIPAKV